MFHLYVEFNSRLLVRILTSLENIKDSLKNQSSMLQNILRQGSITVPQSVPEGVDLPIKSIVELDAVEMKLLDGATEMAVVSFYLLFIFIDTLSFLIFLNSNLTDFSLF